MVPRGGGSGGQKTSVYFGPNRQNQSQNYRENQQQHVSNLIIGVKLNQNIDDDDLIQNLSKNYEEVFAQSVSTNYIIPFQILQAYANHIYHCYTLNGGFFSFYFSQFYIAQQFASNHVLSKEQLNRMHESNCQTLTLNFAVSDNQYLITQKLSQSKKLHGIQISHANTADQNFPFNRLDQCLRCFSPQHLSILHSNFQQTELLNIFNILHEQNSLQSLNISHTSLDKYKAQALANWINNHSKLRFLTLDSNNFFNDNDGGLQTILRSFKFNRYLLHLAIRNNFFPSTKSSNSQEDSYNPFSTDTIEYLAWMLQGCIVLISLDLSRNYLADSNLLLKVLAYKSSCNNIRYLNLSHCQIDTHRTILTALNSGLKLYELNLSGCELGRAGFITIAMCMRYQRNQCLQILNLQRCRGDVQGMRYLLKALQTNKKLQFLNISQNFGDSELGQDIKLFLQINQSVKFMNLRKLGLKTQGASAVCEGIRDNMKPVSVLKRFYDLRKNKISQQCKEKLQKFKKTDIKLFL